MRVAERVGQAVLEMTTGPDPDAAIDRHYAPDFIQHSPIFPGGRDGLKAMVKQAKDSGATYELLQAIGEGDHAVLFARVTGLAEEPVLLFNFYRVAGDVIAEHWEGIQPESLRATGDPLMPEGHAQITDLDRTAQNRDLVRDLIEKVLIGGNVAIIDDYVDEDKLIHHNPLPLDNSVEYVRLHRIIAEGNFVFSQSEGKIDGVPHAILQLVRVEDGKIVEHWDVATAVPAQLQHDNGIF
ncbi:MAG TPA: nuclear transport factor 2 family protein [Streptosporangiaceae bacterium]|nr:nuclear transport factor 2 family protein [Streptosporangiaceae bacterium]